MHASVCRWFFPLRCLFLLSRREPQGVVLRAGSGAQWDAGGRRAQAGLHRHLPLRQRLHAGGRPNPHLHHGGRRQAELEQGQASLHRWVSASGSSCQEVKSVTMVEFSPAFCTSPSRSFKRTPCRAWKQYTRWELPNCHHVRNKYQYNALF